MEIIWYGTATVLLNSNGKSILFDPFTGLEGAENKTDINKFFKKENIFITHGHFDHLSDIKEIIENGEATVYCGEVPYKILEKRKADLDKIVVINPHDNFNFDDIKIKVIKSTHNKTDMLLVLKHLADFFRNMKYLRNFFNITVKKRDYIEGNETSAFIVEAENKKMLILGSMGLPEEEKNELDNIDILVLPYQGKFNNAAAAKEIIEKILPKTVVLSHFDDSFPPMTEHVDTQPFIESMKNEYPEITVIKPEYERAIEF